MQATHLRAPSQNLLKPHLLTLPESSIFFGKHQVNPQTCRNCGYSYNASSEKMTDVNIAVELLQDAFLDAFDTALLISADSSLARPTDSPMICAPRLMRTSK